MNKKKEGPEACSFTSAQLFSEWLTELLSKKSLVINDRETDELSPRLLN